MSPPEPRISAVIPAYNREKTIERAIRSALDQAVPPFEVVVVDDGSSDGTPDRVAAFGDPVVLVRQEQGGASASRNRGAREARGEWIAFLDSDDYWLEGHLERAARAIRETGGRASLYFADTDFAPSLGGKPLWTLAGFSIRPPHEIVEDAAEWAMMAFQPMMLQTSVFRRETFLALGGLREDLRSRHDTHLFFAACLGRPACAVAGIGARMTDDDASGARVTATHGTHTVRYWEETEILYRDILAKPSLRARHRRELRYRLASAELHLARFARTSGESAAAARYLLRAVRHSPRRIGEGLLRRLSREGPG